MSNGPTQVRRQLHAQLQDSHETRWHAAQLFTRYFYRLGSARSQTASPTIALCKSSLTEDALLAHEGREVVTWDCAVACVALSVKASVSGGVVAMWMKTDREDGSTVPTGRVPPELHDTSA